ncbi:translation initiation factor IF-2 [Flavilitoribacter nigricans]|uniref:Translation initiation factor IF-2 n=1 Tax=Flavilitoribacter nigricans (strain ATCC 23147 / DSM 23189 / NBRC 102662 / NCIMB 1420 / SS-2) TaxID=1122177 RepID=A0A2D0N671_FLAN2|nr:translation initiation factor IF-2 [Flavilitoribacter nigricans]PHN03994.1 translation initiation factor IF-2 [Flavilitoribacter nigricans DSM 23189 = NBRC 102662]
MEKRLIKIAKELNVGTSTIVDHLTKAGFDIDNKPTAKVSDEMYTELLKEFQKSIAIKEKADSLVIGNRPVGGGKGAPESPPTPLFNTPESEAPADKKEAAQPGAQEKEKKSENRISLRPQPQLKVVGKIDLENKEKPQAEKASQPEASPVQPPVKEEVEKPAAKSEPVQPAEKPEPVAKKEKEEAPAKEEKEPAKETAPAKETTATPPVAEKQPTQESVKEQKAEAEKPVVEQPKIEKKEPVSEQKEEKPVAKEKEQQEEKPAKSEPAPHAAPAAKTETPPASSPPKPKAAEASSSEEQTTKDPESVIRAEAPELRGLKILGKIDTDKLKRPKKKKKETAKKETGKAGTTDNKKTSEGGDDSNAPRKRRRKRKKITTDSPRSNQSGGNRGSSRGGQGGGRGRNQKDEVKEVSQKEIEEKIKATMARISGGGKRKRQKIRRESRERTRERQEMMEMETTNDKLNVTEFISVQELANLMDVSVSEVIMTCMNLGVIVSINQRLDAEIIELVASEYGHEVEFITAEEQIGIEDDEIEDDPEDLEPRAPIVTVMGHVDHGKTSLLDYIRSANVVSGEAGGITQHIGAYEVTLSDNRSVTFLDTPGHEAFTAMRARGAKVTDIAIVIISADDSIMPQTREAISHAEAAGVPIVFAINKIDKPGANPEKIKQDLASMNYLVESWGGKYQSQDISAKTGQGIEDLLEKVLLEAELLELKANPDRPAVGVVLEASLEKGRGYVAKMLVNTGTLKIGDPVVAGEHSGKIKAMFNERNQRVKEAGPSDPVLVLGLDGAPQAGETVKVTESEQDARQIANKRAQIIREQANRATKRISLDEIGRRLALGNFKELNLIVKGDVDGSIEALSDSLIKLSQETVQVNVIHKAVGQIIESDVLLASASDAIIIGFQVRPSIGARRLAEREGVQIKMYSIIYEAIEEIKLAIEGMLEPTKEEKIVAQVLVREVFKISKVGTVAGCYVEEGKITRNTKVRIIRDGIVIYPTRENVVGELSSLKRFKEDVREVKNGLECGLTIKNFNDIKVGDIVEGYEVIEIKQKLEL